MIFIDIKGEWQGDDSDALSLLEDRGIRANRGGLLLVPLLSWSMLDDNERAALLYLCAEWDYAMVMGYRIPALSKSRNHSPSFAVGPMPRGCFYCGALPVVVNLDNEDLCKRHADEWCQAEELAQEYSFDMMMAQCDTQFPRLPYDSTDIPF